MSQPVSWSPEAVDALDEIHAFLELRSPHAADEWVGEVARAVQNIADFPEIGVVAAGVRNRRIRQYPVGGYRLIYRLHADGVTIESIVSRSTSLR